MDGSRDTPPVHNTSSCGETSETILSRSSLHGADYAGQMCRKPLADLKIVFEDGDVDVNSAALAALSEEFGAYKYIDFQEDGGANGKNGATPVPAAAAALSLGITLVALGRALV